MQSLRRVVFYLFYDAQGIVDDYVTYKLAALRPHVDHIFVVSNSMLTPEGRHKLEGVADTVWARENVGFDVWAYKEAMETFGADRLAEYDELVLMNYTFFGPIFPFSETFERMDARDDIEFWGLTAHKSVDPNPFTGATGVLPMHIQSHWIAVRKPMFTSIEFAHYWQTMPMITTYDESVLQHESRFTEYFADRGFRYVVAFDPGAYPSDHPIFENAVLMLGDRCPIIKRRIFFHEPTYLDRNAILGRRVLDVIERSDYPVDLIWRNVVRSAEPRHLYTNFSLLEVLPETDDGWRPAPPPRILVVAHIYYTDMVDEIMGYVRNIPVPFDLVVTTTSEEKRESILEQLADQPINKLDIRVVADNRGRDMSAFLIACRDVLATGAYDLVCKVHSKKSPQDAFNAADLFKRHMFDNILYTPGYVVNLLRLFEQHESLGMVFPPIVNIGYPTLGHSWFTNRPMAEVVAKQIGISTQFDSTTPLAPYGSMFWARPEALLKMVDHPWTWEDYPDDHGYGDGGLPHVQERLMAYTVLDAGYQVRSVINRDWASINYCFLEYKLQRISSMLPAYTQEQVDFITSVKLDGPAVHSLKAAVDELYPRLGQALRPGYRVARATRRTARALLKRG